MTDSAIPYHVTDDAAVPLIQYCRDHQLDRFFLVVDPNTYRILGQRVEAALRSAGIDIKRILLTGEDIAADEHYAVQALVETDGEDRPFIAVGSGTITDITRFISHRTHTFFLSLPTAPSVDGYTSTVAPLIVSKYKATIAAHAPAAVFADLPTLCAAPRAMIAAGLGDLLGKYTSLADWRIGALLYDEPYDAGIDRQMREVVDSTVAAIDQVEAETGEGITRLMDGLVKAGFIMLAFGDSRPASGSEHHLSHYWEMRFILEGRPAVLHGAKVGVATLLAAQRYEQLRAMTRQQAQQRLDAFNLPTREQTLAEIRTGYGPAAGLIEQVQAPLLTVSHSDVEALKARILTHWEAVQEIAQTVPAPALVEEWLKRVGGPTSPSEIGLDTAAVQSGLRYAHYLRDRFTLNRLRYWMKWS